MGIEQSDIYQSDPTFKISSPDTGEDSLPPVAGVEAHDTGLVFSGAYRVITKELDGHEEGVTRTLKIRARIGEIATHGFPDGALRLLQPDEPQDILLNEKTS